jgi:hypothetical protein
MNFQGVSDINPLKPSGNYMSQLSETIKLYFIFMGFCMVLTVNIDYLIKQH